MLEPSKNDLEKKLEGITKCIEKLVELGKVKAAPSKLNVKSPNDLNDLVNCFKNWGMSQSRQSSFFSSSSQKKISTPAELETLFKQSSADLFNQLVILTQSSITGLSYGGLDTLPDMIEHVKLFQKDPSKPTNLANLIYDARQFHTKIDAYALGSPAYHISKSYRQYAAVGLIVLGVMTAGVLAPLAFPTAYNLLYPTPGMCTKDAIDDLLKQAQQLVEACASKPNQDQWGVSL